MFRRLLVFMCLLPACLAPASAEQPLTVFAAASVREAMERIGAAFEEQTGTQVVLSFAGTGTLARQVEAGAPADIFVSADAAWMDYVRERGAVRADTIREIASNALVLVGPSGSPAIELDSEGLRAVLDGGRMAIADPETVPAGRYGKAALEKLGLWQAVSPHLAPMENVRIALASVARGDTPLGLVYSTDAAIEPAVSVVAQLPQASHPRIRYLAALTTSRAHPSAQGFLDFLDGPRSEEVLRSLGFVTDKNE
ncbi:molybdate ABC transporter substrate-binding protein [Roseibium salinum]|uniref:Molybdate ABC transporter substrate-binding protein n=1 Tax=Roseibium salinum TaxID=1604349 RepID=A0ABT3R640_9HYPH|nr:molybdate ABC transporter substrate-binding protein [Roseibium sp. DSM 29163]MCX2724713.1 molybdate ABC transporter substrate-binding protein [Roseibium sp. DSM 29163]